MSKPLKISDEAHKQLKLYSEISNQKMNYIVNNLIFKEVSAKTLTNDWIVLDKPLYFNMDVLLKERSVKCELKPNVADSESYFVLKRVPNNLDELNTSEYTYCYDNDVNLHCGVYPIVNYNGFEINWDYYQFFSDIKFIEENIINLIVFNYNENTGDVTLSLNTTKNLKPLLKELSATDTNYVRVDLMTKQIKNGANRLLNHSELESVVYNDAISNQHRENEIDKFKKIIGYAFNWWFECFVPYVLEAPSDVESLVQSWFNELSEKLEKDKANERDYVEPRVRHLFCQKLLENPLNVHFVAFELRHDRISNVDAIFKDTFLKIYFEFFNKF